MSKRRIVIRVTEKHIAEGKRHSPCGCPIAVALRDCGLEWVSVGGASAYYGREGIAHKIDLSEAARRFIRAFDKGQPVTPATFWAIEEKEN